MYKKAFTLAEVLITLGIIGVVAAMTLPTLIQNYKDKERVTALKKQYSIFSQALKMAEFENGAVAGWVDKDAPREEKANIYREKIFPQLKILKDCTDQQAECYGNKVIKLNWGDDTYTGNIVNNGNHWIYGTLADGTDFIIEVQTTPIEDRLPDNTIYASIDIDLNGLDKLPNKVGEDYFYFWITDKGVIPRGTPDSTEGADFEQTCLTKHHGCTSWVILNGNMDYLRCPDKIRNNHWTSCKG